MSSEILKQTKDYFNDLLMKIETNKVQMYFQQNIENKTIARMLEIRFNEKSS